MHPDPRARFVDHLPLVDHYLRARGVPSTLREDARQEMLLLLWEVRGQWDPARGTWATFAYAVMRRPLAVFAARAFRVGHYGGRHAHTRAVFHLGRLVRCGEVTTPEQAAAWATAAGVGAPRTPWEALVLLGVATGEVPWWGDGAPPSGAENGPPGTPEEDAAGGALVGAWEALLGEARAAAEGSARAVVMDARLLVSEDKRETLGQVGARLGGLSGERVRQIEARARWHIREGAIQRGLLPKDTRVGR